MSSDEKIPNFSVPEYTEYELIEKRLKEIGWEDAKNYDLNPNELLENYIINKVFIDQLEKINYDELKNLKYDEKNEVLQDLYKRLSFANEREVLNYLIYGFDSELKDHTHIKLRLIDYNNLSSNKFLFGAQAKFPGNPENVKPDYTLFINGLPVAIIEAKRTTEIDSHKEALNQISRYTYESPELFKFVQLGIAYGDEKMYVPTWPKRAGEERHVKPFVWKVMDKESYVDDIFDLLKPETLLRIIRWYTFFTKDIPPKKIIARYNQFYASEEAIKLIENHLNGAKDSNRGLIWHWQGSGKTYTMIYIARQFFEKHLDKSPIVFFMVDRIDLQKQLLEEFLENSELPNIKPYITKVESASELRKELEKIKESESKRGVTVSQIYVVLIQKFKKQQFLAFANRFGGINKKEMIILIDEAHRSQYGTLAAVVKRLFPNAVRLAFTGTPVFKKDRNTFVEFSYPDRPYLHVYFIKDSIRDGFTIPLAYDVVKEKGKEEGVRILLSEDEIKSFIESWEKDEDEVEDYMEGLGQITQEEIAEHLNHIKVILTNEKRIKRLAEYIVSRIKDDTEDFRFKAMVVMVNRKSCVIMKEFLDEELKKAFPDKDTSGWTEVVMTYMQNDEEKILEYKKKLMERYPSKNMGEINRIIQDKFKHEEDPKILIVTDMLITGFDAPILRVMYLDKPLYEHRLLQTIARVNRPYNDEKKFGLIVDSIGLLSYLKESISRYETLAEKNISEDLLSNVFATVDQKAEELEKLIETIKQELKYMKIDGEDLSIDVDYLMNLHEKKDEYIKAVESYLKPRAKMISLYRDRNEVIKLLSGMRDIERLFKELGAHTKRPEYEDQVAIIYYIYLLIRRYIFGEKLDERFWQSFVDIVHEKTDVKPFEILRSTVIDEINLSKITAKRTDNLLLSQNEVADMFIVLNYMLSRNIDEPLYRMLYKRLENLRKSWTNRHVKLDETINELMMIYEELKQYEAEIQNKTAEEKIIQTVKRLASEEFNVPYANLELKKFKEELAKIKERKLITQKEEKELSVALLLDLFKELKGVERNKIQSFTEETIDYAIKKLKENARNQS